MTTLADLLAKAGTFATQWRDQCGCNAQVLDELADAIEGYLAAPPQRGEHERLDEFLASQGFYELMLAYRHANIMNQPEVSAAFEAVKAALRKAVR